MEANDALHTYLLCVRLRILKLMNVMFSSCLFPQDNHEEDYFLYVAYSDESVYGKWVVEAQQMGAPGLGGRGRGVCGTWGKRGRAPTVEETEGKTSGNTTPHTPSSYFHTLSWYFLLLPQPREKACQDRGVELALIEEWRRFNFTTFLWINFCVTSQKRQEAGKLGPEMIVDHQ